MNIKTETRRLGWEKWVNPYGEEFEEAAWPGAFGDFASDDAIERLERRNNGELEEWEESGGCEPEPQVDMSVLVAKGKHGKHVKLLMTPMGFVPMTEWNNPGKIFNFWIAHTNFRITEEIQDIIDKTDGVESLDVFSPYRWRIAIGHAFNSIDVKELVRTNLSAEPLIRK
jgi:hypothetical protein